MNAPVTRADLDRASRCTAGDQCPEHPDVRAVHSPLMHIDVDAALLWAVMAHDVIRERYRSVLALLAARPRQGEWCRGYRDAIIDLTRELNIDLDTS